MTALLLSPHQDDAVLFACFLALQHDAHIVTCYYGADERADEDAEAFAILGLEHTLLPNPDWADFPPMLPTGKDWDMVIAPAWEPGGHDQHNLVALAAGRVFGENVIRYSTYTRQGGRTRGREVVPEPWMIALKHQALACYQSQIENPMTRDWFLGDLREYVL